MISEFWQGHAVRGTAAAAPLTACALTAWRWLLRPSALPEVAIGHRRIRVHAANDRRTRARLGGAL